MGDNPVSTTVRGIRRLAVAKQHLAGKVPEKGTKDDVIDVVRDLAFVQWDPVAVVAPSHIISLWNRVGAFSLSDLDSMLWNERTLLLHWTPVASIVLSEDYPIYCSLMERYPDSLSHSWGAHRDRAKEFLARNKELKRDVLRDLEGGPLVLEEFRRYVRTGRSADGWSTENAVSQMLFHLMMQGRVMVVGRRGNQNVWGLAERFLPGWVDREPLGWEEMERRTAERAIRGMGTATPSEIHFYFVRGRYQNLKKALQALEEDAAITRVEVRGSKEKEVRYVHRKDVPLLESVEADGWQPRVALLSPFDNLICGRTRTRTVFDFDYVHEQFVPKDKRKYGTYVVPILAGERLVGRMDPRLDKAERTLFVNSVHAEPGAQVGREVVQEIAGTIERLASFVGAKGVEYSPKVPEAWRGALR
ncbi:MAG: YcaQ family DNA glycosylase [Nitrososphaerota archaeon]|jgi:uncharacterized protein YcaQ|nr:YcaQ family DNA glycosylase [Nitrososphaerota archaeon]